MDAEMAKLEARKAVISHDGVRWCLSIASSTKNGQVDDCYANKPKWKGKVVL